MQKMIRTVEQLVKITDLLCFRRSGRDTGEMNVERFLCGRDIILDVLVVSRLERKEQAQFRKLFGGQELQITFRHCETFWCFICLFFALGSCFSENLVDKVAGKARTYFSKSLSSVFESPRLQPKQECLSFPCERSWEKNLVIPSAFLISLKDTSLLSDLFGLSRVDVLSGCSKLFFRFSDSTRNSRPVIQIEVGRC